MRTKITRLKEKKKLSPFQIDPLINNITLNKVVSILKVFVFILKFIAIVFVIAFMATGLYFLFITLVR